MEYYNNRDNIRERIQTVRITLQSEEYKGHIAYKIKGRHFGKNIFYFDPECIDQSEIESYCENDCGLKVDEDTGYFEFTLKDEHGSTCEYTAYNNELDEYIVAIEIIDCEVIKNP